MLFKYEPGSAHKQFKEQGYVHLKDVLADDFVDYMTAFYEETQKTASGEAEACTTSPPAKVHSCSRLKCS